MTTQGPRLYRDLASWWPLLSTVEDYEEEEALYARLLAKGERATRSVLGLGAGGGSNAYFLKRYFSMTLVDRSPAMLAVSRTINPECRHLEGDMRCVCLGERFDAVFIHDAIGYMTSSDDIRAVLTVAGAHTAPGGLLLVVPDCFKETFCERTEHGGSDGREGRSLRYLEWVYDPEPDDTTYVADMVYLLRHSDGETEVVHDRHLLGVFPQEEWLAQMKEAGFCPTVCGLSTISPPGYSYRALVGIRGESP